ncbi:MAG: DUF2461 domain-containing protein [Ignavibacteria bacterium]|nr:DUF2461 domain-containing protein [Ignavibacteria bacterium]
MAVTKVATFPDQTIQYLRKLGKNNSREWFEAHRDDYELDFLVPATQFVLELGDMLETIAPDIHAIPKIDKSIFRLHRDVRFSKDKSPYKTNLGMYFWEGSGKKMEATGFYVHIEPKKWFLGCGIYMFTKEQMKAYRDAVVDPVSGAELHAICKKLTKNGQYVIGGKKFKKIPRDYDPGSPYAEYLLHDGIHGYFEGDDMSTITTTDFAEFCFKHFKAMLPMHKWLMKYIM